MTITFTPADRARVRLAVEDYAGRYHGGPLGLGREDTARYVAEGHLDDLCEKHGFAAVVEAVEELIDQHPEVLADKFTHAQITQRERDRAARADERLAEAGRAFKAGAKERALALINEAELIAPRHRPRRGGYDWYRSRVC